ncbi:DUF6226 family protein [Microbacterium gorillae]|uniref:DUF6226 family protein n=1 Tax=Microbacterium gorillae TaxID=1231063 RepID=UPI003D98E9D6
MDEPALIGQDDFVSYVRPPVTAPVFHDAEGRVIEYGRRWVGSPPEDAYSVDADLERFAPLHVIADALITHLRDTYDVEIDEGMDVLTDLFRQPSHGVVRVVRIRPNRPSCATLSLALTDYPGVFLHAGAIREAQYPVCGCNACDSNWPDEAENLEREVFAVVNGTFRETLIDTPAPVIDFASVYPDGSISGQAFGEEIPVERWQAALELLRDRPDGWAPWPRRP